MVNILIPMAGLGKRFSDAGYVQPKPFIRFDSEKTMIEAVIKNLLTGFSYDEDFTLNFVVNKKQLDLNYLYSIIGNFLPKNKYNIIDVDYVPNGPAESCFIGLKHISPDEELIIVNCDQIIEDFYYGCFQSFCKLHNLDGCLGVFNSISPKNSYVKINSNNLITEVKEKQVISNIATNGFHWFKKAQYFSDAFNKMKEKKDTFNLEYYVAPSYNYLIENGGKVMPYYFNLHFPIGTPPDFEFYKERLDKNIYIQKC